MGRKIDDEALQFVARAKNKGATYQDIKQDLNSKFGIDVSKSTIYETLKDYQEKQGILKEDSVELRQTVVESAHETAQDLKQIREILWDLVQEQMTKRARFDCRECGHTNSVKIDDVRAKIGVIKTIMKQLKTTADLLGIEKVTKVKPTEKKTSMDLLNEIKTTLKELEEQGKIKILEPIK